MFYAHDLNSRATPPAAIKAIYKSLQKANDNKPQEHSGCVDLEDPGSRQSGQLKDVTAPTLLPDELQMIFQDFLNSGELPTDYEVPIKRQVFEVPSIPGLLIYPSVLPPSVQLSLLSKLLHRDLSIPTHKTNLHTHYHIPYPPKAPRSSSAAGEPRSASFFSPSASTLTFHPKDPTLHKPLTTSQVLTKKLRWLTLGGQYDWTHKIYPSTSPPSFPPDISTFLSSLFPSITPEAAILNLYSPGDTLSLHRDVAETSDAPLISISLGCEGIFVIGLDEERFVSVKLRSGDVVVMSGEARFAWHGVPRIVEGSCPEWMREWPAYDGDVEERPGFEQWRGWMAGKRVNLNVRQMFE